MMKKIASPRRKRRHRGSALLVSLMVIVGLSLLGLGFVAISETESAIAKNQQSALQTQSIAEAGARAVVEWFQNPVWGNTNAGLPSNNPAPAGIKTTRTVAAYTGVYKPSSTARLFDKPYRPNQNDRFYGDEDHADIIINNTTDAADITNFNNALLGADRSSGEVTEIKIFAPPIVGGTLTGGFWVGGQRYGLATIKVTAQQFRDPNNISKTLASNVLASHAVRLVVGEIPLPIPGGPIQSNTAISFNGDFKVHWGNETSTGTLTNKRFPSSFPWANAYERPHFEHGYEPGTTIASVSLLSGGSGYTSAPIVTIAVPVPPCGTCTQATATATVAGGKVKAITVTNPGTGYVSTPPSWGPTVTIAGGGGTGASAQAIVGAEAWPITGAQFEDANYFNELIDKALLYEDPWFGSRAVGDNLADGVGPPSPANAQCFPYSYTNTENSPSNASYNFQWQSVNAYPWQKIVQFPTIKYDFWKKIASQSRGYKGIYYFTYDGAGAFKRSSIGTSQTMCTWVNTNTNGLGPGVYFFDTANQQNPQGGGPGILTPAETFKSACTGGSFLMVGFVYMNTTSFGTQGIGTSMTSVNMNFPGEPYRDIGYPKWDPVANNWDTSCGGTICRGGAGDGVFSYQDLNGNGKFDVVVMPTPAFNSYDPGPTGHLAGATYIVKTWKSPAQATADYGAPCTVPAAGYDGTNPAATDCSEPHEPYMNIIYPNNTSTFMQIGWEAPTAQTYQPKRTTPLGVPVTCTSTSPIDDCTSNAFDLDGALVAHPVLLDGVLYNEGDYSSEGNAEYYGSLLIQGTVGGTGTPDVWFDEKLLKGTWAPPGMPRVMVFSEQTDEIGQ